MSFFHVLQVIIAIIFIYLTLSLLVTEIQEAFAGFLQFRAKNLKDSIKILFNENPRDQNTLTDQIYKTHRIKSLNQYTSTLLNWIPWKVFHKNPFKVGPSYINKEDFVDAVLEHLDDKLEDFIANDPNDPNIIKVQKVIDKIKEKNNNEELKPEDELYPLVTIAKLMKLKQKDPTIKDFKQELESIFEKAEKRTIGVYKRNAKGVSFLMGFLLAASLNVDFFYIVDKMAKNPESAASLTSVAEEVFENNLSAYEAYTGCGNDKNTDECQQTLRNFEQGVRESIPETNLSEIFGWGTAMQNLELFEWVLKIPGWIISAIAMAMGAPFWFDLLEKFLNVRNAAKPFELKPPVPNKEEDKKKKPE